MALVRLNTGDPAPDFDVRSIAGRRWSSATLRGSPSLLIFHRYARCAVCNERIRELKSVLPGLRARTGLKVMFVCHSSEEALQQEFGALGLPLDIVSDPNMELYATFGVATSIIGLLRARSLSTIVRARRAMPSDGKRAGLERPLTMIPADFFVDAEGRFVSAHYGEYLGDTWPIETIERMATEHSATECSKEGA